MSLFTDTLRHMLSNAGIAIDAEQIAQCEAYYRRVTSTNAHTNLTRIIDEADAATRHFAEAILLFHHTDLPQRCRIIDIGTGAGFPGMPLKLYRPDIDITLLDASGKKTDFIRSTAKEMGIDVTVICDRAEDTAHTDLRESFDVAVSRAVAPLNMLTELCAPFIKTGGLFAAWKGESYRDELQDAKNAMAQLGCSVRSIHPVGRGALILSGKQKPAPDMYPRRFAKIKSQPL